MEIKNLMFETYQNIPEDYIPNNTFPWRLPPDGVRDIVRGTTPEHFIYLPFKKSDIKSILITYKQGFNVVEKKLNDITWDKDNDHLAYYQFTQEETNKFDSVINRPCRVQVRSLLNNGDVIASEMYTIRILKVLNDEVLTNE